LTVPELIKKFAAFIEPEDSLTYSRSSQPDTILSQINAGHNFTKYSSKINFNIIL